MNKIKAVLLGIAMFLPIFMAGCDPIDSGHVKVTSVELKDWTNPKDNEVYVVALPTWTNDGASELRQVTFWAEIEGTDFKPEPPKEPQFYGTIVEPGTTVTPTRVPEDGIVLGIKKDLEKKFGELDASKVVIKGHGRPEEYKPEAKSDA